MHAYLYVVAILIVFGCINVALLCCSRVCHKMWYGGYKRGIIVYLKLNIIGWQADKFS
jgi:hypothetical protein